MPELTPELIGIADAVAQDFYMPGGDWEDVRQEARYAAWVACKDFKPERGIPLGAFVGFVVRRRLGSAINAARRGKHMALTHSDRTTMTPEGERHDIVDQLPSLNSDPLDVLIDRDEIDRLLVRCVFMLSPAERECMVGLATGLTYLEIEDLYGHDEKKIDNAICRARRKLTS